MRTTQLVAALAFTAPVLGPAVRHTAPTAIEVAPPYDYEYTPSAPGVLRIEVRSAGPRGALLVRVPIRVE